MLLNSGHLSFICLSVFLVDRPKCRTICSLGQWLSIRLLGLFMQRSEQTYRRKVTKCSGHFQWLWSDTTNRFSAGPLHYYILCVQFILFLPIVSVINCRALLSVVISHWTLYLVSLLACFWQRIWDLDEIANCDTDAFRYGKPKNMVLN